MRARTERRDRVGLVLKTQGRGRRGPGWGGCGGLFTPRDSGGCRPRPRPPCSCPWWQVEGGGQSLGGRDCAQAPQWPPRPPGELSVSQGRRRGTRGLVGGGPAGDRLVWVGLSLVRELFWGNVAVLHACWNQAGSTQPEPPPSRAPSARQRFPHPRFLKRGVSRSLRFRLSAKRCLALALPAFARLLASVHVLPLWALGFP